MKKLFVVVFLVLLLSSFVSAKLVVWCSENQVPALERLAAEFERDYGIKVEVQQVNFGDIKSNFLVAAPAGEGPDIIVGAHDWVGELAQDGLLEPLPFIPQRDAYYDVALEAFSYGGRLYGLPYALESIAIVYNKDLVFEDEVPTTISELESIAVDVSDDEIVGFVYDAPNFYFSFPFIAGYGGYIFKETADGLDPTDIGLNNEGAAKGVSLIRSWFDMGLIPRGANYSLMDGLFVEGLAAFIINGPWETPKYRDAGIDYGIIPFTEIELEPGLTPKPFVGVQGFMINSRSRSKIEAVEFVVNYMGSYQGQKAMFDVERRGIVRSDLYAEVETQGGPEIYDIIQFSASASVGTPMPNIPEMAAVWGSMEDALNLVINAQDTVQNALDAAVEKIKAAIE
jgi:maltose/maltodextrin transport system substrate-binding protein